MSTFFIGDIHGHDEKLRALLRQIGFTEKRGVWSHPEHRVVFVGDFVDRGPGQLKTIKLVRAMIDAGMAEAVMGNHELNACAWYLPDPQMPGHHLRKRSDKNRHQHHAFLAETENNPALHKELVDWFLTLPLWIETPHYRVIHACWHEPLLRALEPCLDNSRHLNYALVEKSTRKGSFEFKAVEALLKGMEVDLPDGVHYFDKEGIRRATTRISWWDTAARTYKKAAILSSDERAMVPDLPLPPEGLIGYDNKKPLFIGHYWRSGKLDVLTPHIACVDYSAGKGGPLVAYRWDGESILTHENFVSTGSL